MDLEAPTSRLELAGTHHAVGIAMTLLVESLEDVAPGLGARLTAKLATSANAYRSKDDPFSQITSALLANVEICLRQR